MAPESPLKKPMHGWLFGILKCLNVLVSPESLGIDSRLLEILCRINGTVSGCLDVL